MNRPLTVDELLARARASLERLSPAQARDAAARGGLIVDIRSEVQRQAQGLVPGALFVPRNVLEWRADPRCAHHDPTLAVDGPLVLMCAEGYQSSLAAATLQELGVAGATDMAGGFLAWAAAGLPVEPFTRRS
jgi:rhodanese-related sulfurtransferase